MWVKRGLCGLDIRKQTYVIAVLYIILGIFGLVYGFMLIEDPAKGFNKHEEALEEQVELEAEEEVEVAESEDTAEELESGEISSQEGYAYHTLLLYMQKEGVEIVIVSLITIGFSIMMGIGVYRSKSFLLLPWVVQQLVELMIGTGLFVVYAIAGAKFSFLQIVGFCASVVCASYVNYAVLSHYVLMRRMDKTANQVISSVMNGENYTAAGVNYHRLQEEVAAKEMATVSGTVNGAVNHDGNNVSSINSSEVNNTNSNSNNTNGDLFSSMVRMPPPLQPQNGDNSSVSRREDTMYFSID